MRLKLPTLLLALLLSAAAVRADTAFVLMPSALSGVGSNEVFFTASLTNNSLAINYLNSITVTGTATNYLTADTNVFFANVPGILLPGETYSDIVFGIFINTATPHGVYSGTVTIQGGSDIFAAGNLANQTFQISLPPAAMGVAPSGGNLVFSWPSPPGGFVLQQISDLTTTNWAAATNTPTQTNGQNQVILVPTGPSGFYRLQYP